MSIIQTLRNKSWLAAVFVGVAMLAFILGDLFSQNSQLLGKNKQIVGEIAGEEITLQQYQAQVDELRFQVTQRQGGTPPTEEQMPAVREQAWNQLIFEVAYRKQFEELGLTVTDEELFDMVQGTNIHPSVQQSFSNPETNEFDPAQVQNFLGALKAGQVPPEQVAMWANFEQQIGVNRLQTKYENLFAKTGYVTKAEAEREYRQQTTKATAKYVYVPFSVIPDSTVEVTDAELKSYINKNSANYQTEAGRTFDYVTFDVGASGEDSAALYNDLAGMKASFEATENDSAFVALNSTGRPVSIVRLLAPNELPAELADATFELKPGTVYGPFANGNSLSLYKISDVVDSGDVYARAGHILIKPEGDDDAAKREARKEAQRILDEIKGGASFEALAGEFGQDGTSARGGDLGYFGKGRMVAPFEEAVFNAEREGLLPRLVETDFGYHVLKITEAPSSRRYRLVTLQEDLLPSEASREEVYRRAGRFAGTASSAEAMRTKAEEAGLNVLTASQIRKAAQNVNSLRGAGVRKLVQWSYNDAEVGEVSPVFEVGDQYVVAVLTGKQEKGTTGVEEARVAVETQVRNEKKAAQIIEKLRAAGTQNMDSLAAVYPGAKVGTATDLTPATRQIQGVGFDPEAVGTIFGLNEGERAGPVRTNNGVMVVEVTSKTPAAPVADYTQYRTQVEQRQGGRTQFNISEAIRKDADIEDERVRYY
ncbi:MAG: SurA N-terminal domain-containing protein [Catalinimonas sp.]